TWAAVSTDVGDTRYPDPRRSGPGPDGVTITSATRSGSIPAVSTPEPRIGASAPRARRRSRPRPSPAGQARLQGELDPVGRDLPDLGVAADLDHPEPDLDAATAGLLDGHGGLQLNRAELEPQLLALAGVHGLLKLAAQLGDHLGELDHPSLPVGQNALLWPDSTVTALWGVDVTIRT